MKKRFTLFLLFISFILGFSYRHSNPGYLINFKNKYNSKIKKVFTKDFNEKKSYEKYCPEEINSLPKKSTLVIGHAYGSHINSDKRGNTGIAPKVYEFYLNNKQNIESIIFSGDVLKEPSIQKWEKFYSQFKDIKIFIAPGNHDVGGKIFDSALRDVFNITNYKNQKQKSFPYKLFLNDSLFIIGDSNAKESQLDEILLMIDKEEVKKNIYVVIHHVFPEGLSNAANAPGRHEYINNKFFKEKFKKYEKKIYFLYGDGGAYREKPRFKCLKLANTFHLISGIGELPGDTIFVINDNFIYKMKI